MKQLTNRPVAARPQGNNPKFKAKEQGNNGNTNISKIRKATKSIATAPKAGGIFKRFIGQ